MERENIPFDLQLQIWARDNWHCRYCRRPVFFAKALKLFEQLNPGHQYYHPNGKAGALLPLFQWSWASVDHVQPVSAGGRNEPDNLVTACWECNLKWNDKLVGSEKPLPNAIAQNSWDGFLRVWKKLE